MNERRIAAFGFFLLAAIFVWIGELANASILACSTLSTTRDATVDNQATLCNVAELAAVLMAVFGLVLFWMSFRK